MSAAQAKLFSSKPITVRMDISRNAQCMSNASPMFGSRIVGD